MECYLQPRDDGLPMRKSGVWVAEKLDYLQRYIGIFTTSMRNKPWRAMQYIDLFAGPGKCRVPTPHTVYLGSPLLALTAKHSFNRYYFVDLSTHNIAALQARVGVSPLSDRVECLVGDSNHVVNDLVERILDGDRVKIPGRWSSLNLAFLDPDGLELHWETVAALARVNRMDLVIHYPQGGLNRYMGQAVETDQETVVDRFFGGRQWRTEYCEWRARRAGPGLHRLLMDHYRDKLAELGYQEVLRDDEVGDEPLMRNARRRAPLYRLIFASKHARGHQFWRKVTQCDVYGQTRLL